MICTQMLTTANVCIQKLDKRLSLQKRIRFDLCNAQFTVKTLHDGKIEVLTAVTS